MNNPIFQRVFIIAFFLCLLPTLSQAQLDLKSAQLEQEAINHIMNLKERFIILRLTDNQLKINALRKNGYHKQANKQEEKQKKFNQELVAGFETAYQFTTVYYIYSSEYKKWINGESACFLTSELECNENIQPSKEDYYLVQYDFVRQSRIKAEPTKDRTTGRNAEHGGANLRKEGLVVYDKNGVQLEAPFPYSVNTFFIFFGQSLEDMAKKLNNNFENFYSKVKNL